MDTYEKKYKEIVGQLKKAYLYAQTDSTKAVLEEIFPELNESEDEKIRNCIRICLTDVNEQRFKDYGTTLKDCFAWLEKQGKPADINPSEFDLRLNRLLKQFETLPKEELASSLSFYLNVVQNNGTYNEEKQAEQKLPIEKLPEEMKTIVESLGFTSQEICDKYNQMVSDLIMSDDDKGEQKPTDKAKPKFRVKYAGSEYNVFETKDITGVTFYGIEDEPNHIDYVKADNCEIISVYAIKENGSPYPTKPAVFSEKKPKRMISAEAKEAMYDKPAWSEEDEEMFDAIIADIQFTQKAHTHDDNQAVYEREIDWLKSLKQRIGG